MTAMKKTILLLSGATEGPLLAQKLLTAGGFTVLATVTRQEAREHLFGALLQDMQVEVRGFTADSLRSFLLQGGADLVLDATHPFAVRITEIASTVCAQLQVPYVRYQRPDWQPPAETVYTTSYAAAATMLPQLGSRVLLTIGSKQLKYFEPLHDRLTLFARLLPSPASVQQALDAGFAAGHILALRPPFSQDFNRSILREYQIDVLVTKASGIEGGVVEKVMAAHELGLTTLMIRRPQQEGLVTVSTVEAALHACQALFAHS